MEIRTQRSTLYRSRERHYRIYISRGILLTSGCVNDTLLNPRRVALRTNPDSKNQMQENHASFRRYENDQMSISSLQALLGPSVINAVYYNDNDNGKCQKSD